MQLTYSVQNWRNTAFQFQLRKDGKHKASHTTIWAEASSNVAFLRITKMFPNKSAWLIAKQAFEKKKNKNNEQQSGWELECRCIPNDVDQISEYGCNDSSVFISTTTEVSNDQIPIGDCDVRRSKGDGQ